MSEYIVRFDDVINVVNSDRTPIAIWLGSIITSYDSILAAE